MAGVDVFNRSIKAGHFQRVSEPIKPKCYSRVARHGKPEEQEFMNSKHKYYLYRPRSRGIVRILSLRPRVHFVSFTHFTVRGFQTVLRVGRGDVA